MCGHDTLLRDQSIVDGDGITADVSETTEPRIDDNQFAGSDSHTLTARMKRGKTQQSGYQ